MQNSPFAGVVGVGDSSELLELGLELGVGDTLVDSVDKELAALLSVGGHDDRSVGSLSLSQAKQVRRRGSRVSLQQLINSEIVRSVAPNKERSIPDSSKLFRIW